MEINPDGNILDKDGNLWIKQPDGNLVGPDGSVMLLDGTVIPVTSESNFTWVNNPYGYEATGQSEKGYYKYTGTGESTVVIPHVINGHLMTSYYYMFYGTGADVTKVISNNTNVTNMAFMFSYSRATSLDLRELNTSKVTTMNSMFHASRATTLDSSSFDTSNVTDMSAMFASSSATKGYAKTQTDADRFNASSSKPSTLTFYTK